MDKLYYFSDLMARSCIDADDGRHRTATQEDALYERYESASGGVRTILSAVTAVGLVFVAVAQWVY